MRKKPVLSAVWGFVIRAYFVILMNDVIRQAWELNSNLFKADSQRFLMPTYEYSCQKCGQNFDAFQSMRDEPFSECPKELCRLPKWGHGKVKRLPGTGAGLIFKGSGFYITDYRSDLYKEAAKKESPAAP